MRTLSVLILFLPLIGLSQKQDADPEKLSFKEYRLDANMIAPSQIKFPFSRIRMIDARYDTSKFGFTVTGFFSRFRKATFKGGVAACIEKYYTDYYEKSFDSTGPELVIVIKRFWLSNLPGGRNKQSDAANIRSLNNSFSTKWEYYFAKDGNYLPIKRVDTVWTLTEELDKHIEDEFQEKKEAHLKFLLKAMIEMLEYERAVAAFQTQPKKTWPQVLAFNNSRFQLPVLMDSAYKKGVYLNFNEFRNNNPSISNFTEKKMKYTPLRSEKYIEDVNGNDIAAYWGYSEGDYVRFGKNGNDRLYRVGNTFQFYLKVVFDSYQSNGNASNPYATKRRSEVWIPYQLDMETGSLY